MVGNVLFKVLRTVYIVVIGVFANNDIGVGYHVFDVHYLFDVFVRVNAVWIGSHNVPPFMVDIAKNNQAIKFTIPYIR